MVRSPVDEEVLDSAVVDASNGAAIVDFQALILDEVGALPLYRRVAEGLRRHILSGTLPDGLRLPPEAELAAQMGVSHLTLRKGLKILADQGLVAQRQRCGTFVTNRPLPSRRIGLVINSRDVNHDRYIQRIISLLSRRFFQHEPRADELVLLPLDAPDPRHLLAQVNRSGCEGLLLALYHPSLQQLFCGSAFAHIVKVFIGSALRFPGGDECFVSRQAPGAATMAVEYLRERNHHRVAYLSCGLEYESLQQRNAEYLEARRRFGLDEAPDYVALDDGLDWYLFARRTAERLCRMPAARRPTALFCPGITFAYGAWQGVMDAGLRIPEDVSLLGYDADPTTNPGLSSVEEPLDEIIDKAVKLLLDQFRQGKHLKQRVYEAPARIVERGSCRTL